MKIRSSQASASSGLASWSTACSCFLSFSWLLLSSIPSFWSFVVARISLSWLVGILVSSARLVRRLSPGSGSVAEGGHAGFWFSCSCLVIFCFFVSRCWPGLVPAGPGSVCCSVSYCIIKLCMVNFCCIVSFPHGKFAYSFKVSHLECQRLG
jgi:hypothetical protein